MTKEQWLKASQYEKLADVCGELGGDTSALVSVDEKDNAFAIFSSGSAACVQEGVDVFVKTHPGAKAVIKSGNVIVVLKTTQG